MNSKESKNRNKQQTKSWFFGKSDNVDKPHTSGLGVGREKEGRREAEREAESQVCTDQGGLLMKHHLEQPLCSPGHARQR